MPNRTNRRPDIDNDVMATMIRSGSTLEQVAIFMRCTTATVRLRMLKLGVILPPRGRTKRYPLRYGGDRQVPVKAWRKRHPEATRVMQRARHLVRQAIIKGDLVRPETCENDCGAVTRPQAAHHDYDRPLDVRWLCHACHAIWDHDEPKTAAYDGPLPS